MTAPVVLETPVDAAGELWESAGLQVADGMDGGRAGLDITTLSREHMVRSVLGGSGFPQRPHHYGLPLNTDSLIEGTNCW
jgi:hypothetical protein